MTVSKPLVREQVARILASRHFRRSARSARFLRFIVEMTLQDRVDRLKEYEIGLKVFDKAKAFDPRLDATVRVGANDMRSRLVAYYADEGRGDPVVISVPLGGYVPIYQEATPQKIELTRLVSPDTPEDRLFCGRARELQTLHDRFERTLEGRGGMVCLVAEPGVGKTALAETFLRHAEASASVGRGSSPFHVQKADAYAPWRRALADLISKDRQSRLLLEEIAPSWHHLLQSDHAGVLEAGIIRRDLLRLLVALSGHRPIALFFDDLQWADRATIDLISSLGPSLPSMRLLLLMAYRESDMQISRHVFLRVEAEFRMRGFLEEVRLPEFQGHEVEKYLGSRFENHLFGPSTISAICEASGGNALCLSEMVEHAVRHAWIVQQDGRYHSAVADTVWRTELPQTVRGMVAKKVRELVPSDHDALCLCSMSGVEFDSKVVSRVRNQDRDALLAILDRLASVHQIVRPCRKRSNSHADFEFTHVLYRDGLAETISPVRSLTLSVLLADAIIAEYAAEPGTAANVSRLLEEAGDWGRAIAYYATAATEALRVSAYAQAMDTTDHALTIAQKSTRTEAVIRTEIRLLTIQSVALSALRGYAGGELERVCRQAQSLAIELGDPSASIPTDFTLWSLTGIANHDRGAEMAESLAAKAAATHDAELLVSGQTAIGLTAIQRGRFREAQTALDRAREHWLDCPNQADALVTTFVDPGIVIRCNRARNLSFLGRLDEAKRACEQAVDESRRIGHRKTMAYAFALTADVAHLRRDAAATLHWAAEALALAQEFEFQFELIWSMCFQASGLAESGKPTEACALFEKYLVGMGYQGPCTSKLLCGYAVALIGCGRLEDARRILQDAQSYSTEHAEHYYDPELVRLEGDIILLNTRSASDLKSAERLFGQAIEIARDQENRLCELRARRSLTRLQFEHKRSQARSSRNQLRVFLDKFKQGLDTPDLIECRHLLEQIVSAA